MTKNPQAGIVDDVVAQRSNGHQPADMLAHADGIACAPPFPEPGTHGVVSTLHGALVLGGKAHVDFEFPGALPLAWQRRYSSYVNLRHGGHCGLLGFGWRTPLEWHLVLDENGSCLHHADGRCIRFGMLAPGESLYSASEDLWMLASATQTPAWCGAQSGHQQFRHLPPHLVHRPDVIFVGDRSGDMLWTFAPVNRKALEAGIDTVPAAQWQLLGRIDRFGRTQRYRYGEVLGGQRLVAVRDGVDRWYQLHYEQIRAPRPEPRYPSGYFWQHDSGVRLSRIELPGHFNARPQTLVRYCYSPEGDLIEVHDRNDESTHRFAYSNHVMVMHQQRGGPEHHYRYERHEPGARVVEQRSQLGLKRSFSYETWQSEDQQAVLKTRVTDSLDRREAFLVKGKAGLARVVQHQRADGSCVQQAHDAHGHLIHQIDPLGRITHWAYDAYGRMIRTRHPDGSERRQQWDASTGRLVRTADESDRRTLLHYDDWRRLVSIEHAGGGTERFEYPDPIKHALCADLPLQITHAHGGTSHFSYSHDGLIQQLIDPDGSTTEHQFTADGKRVLVSNVFGESDCYEFDKRGLLTQHNRADGCIEMREYDRCNQLVARRLSSGDQADADVRSRPLTQFRYDIWGRLTGQRHADQKMNWEYDDAGRLIAFTNSKNERVQLWWDAMNRVTQLLGPELQMHRWKYDACGQIVELSDSASEGLVTCFEWNECGQLSTCTTAANVSMPTSKTRFWWSKTGALLHASEWRRNAADEEVLISEVVITRDALGRVVSESQRLFAEQSGALEFEHHIAHTLNLFGQRVASELQDLGSVVYQLEPTGHVNSIHWQGSALVEFERDDLMRETRRRIISADMTRNIHRSASGRSQSLQWNGHRLPSHESQTDIAGSLQYDVNHRVYATQSNQNEQQCADADATVRRRYRYDPLGRCIAAYQMDADSKLVQTDYLGWDGDKLVRVERHTVRSEDDLSTTQVIHIVHEPGTRIPLVQWSIQRMSERDCEDIRTRYFLADHRGIPMGLVDEQGEIIWTAFQDPLNQEAALHNPHQIYQAIGGEQPKPSWLEMNAILQRFTGLNPASGLPSEVEISEPSIGGELFGPVLRVE